jgi:hypothetical protein
MKRKPLRRSEERKAPENLWKPGGLLRAEGVPQRRSIRQVPLVVTQEGRIASLADLSQCGRKTALDIRRQRNSGVMKIASAIN